MGSLDDERAQIMILRAWVEAGSQHRLRIRMTRVTQDCRSEPATSTAATIDHVCAVVRSWLEDLLDDTGR
jgi:hypothetical protein